MARWYAVEQNEALDNNEVTLMNEMIGGLSVEPDGDGKTMHIVSNFSFAGEAYHLDVPKYVSGKDYQYTDNAGAIREFVENTAISFLYGSRPLGVLPEGMERGDPVAVNCAIMKADRDNLLLQEYCEGWKSDVSKADEKELDVQVAVLLEYKFTCCRAEQRLAAGKNNGLSMDEERFLAAVYAKDAVDCHMADKELLGKEDYLSAYASNGWSGEKCYSLESFMQEGSRETYYAIAKQCKEHGMKRVYDIGCSTAFQSKIFNAMGMKYVGIEMERQAVYDAPKGKDIGYINAKYPFPIKVSDKKHTAAISNLCVGYELDFKDEALKYDRIAKDFDYFCGSVGPQKFEVFKEKFGIGELSGENNLPVMWASKELLLQQDKANVERVEKSHDIYNAKLPMSDIAVQAARKSLKPAKEAQDISAERGGR